VSIGFENFINSLSIAKILKAESSQARKFRQKADDKRMLINATLGRKPRSIIVMKSNHIVISPLPPTAIKSMIENLMTVED
jgi:regulator of extracellular matrix RemA (YlzA/DUF370 family)